MFFDSHRRGARRLARLVLLPVIFITFGFAADASAAPEGWFTIEPNTDRPGANLFAFYPGVVAGRSHCQTACSYMPRCKSYTYVKPNIAKGIKGRCWLKQGIPHKKANTCCVSGMKNIKWGPRPAPANR